MLSRTAITRRAIWLAGCIGVILVTAPWRGGDGAITVWLLLTVLSFPLGLFPLACYSYFDLSKYWGLSWWLTPLALIIFLGYLQWFVFVPRLFSRVTSNQRLERP